MVLCPRCGKSLSTHQALDYHIKSNVCCKNKNIQNQPEFDVIFVCDYKGNITFIDDASASKYKYSLTELLGKNFHDFIYEPDKEVCYKTHIEFLATKLPQVVQYRRICKDGKLIYVTGFGLLDEKTGNITYFETIILEETSKNLLILNLEGKIIEMSSEFLHNFGHRKPSLLGQYLCNFVRENSIPDFKDAHIQVLSNKSARCTVKFSTSNLEEYKDSILEMYLKVNSISCYLYMD